MASCRQSNDWNFTVTSEPDLRTFSLVKQKPLNSLQLVCSNLTWEPHAHTTGCERLLLHLIATKMHLDGSVLRLAVAISIRLLFHGRAKQKILNLLDNAIQSGGFSEIVNKSTNKIVLFSVTLAKRFEGMEFVFTDETFCQVGRVFWKPIKF